MKCFFCEPEARTTQTLANESWVARPDGFPVSPGHTILILKRHQSSLFDITSEESTALHALLVETRAVLDERYHPDGYNIGVNDGIAAGQSIAHLHVHLIPRYIGDVPNPRGGVRNVLPGGDYTDAAQQSGVGEYLA